MTALEKIDAPALKPPRNAYLTRIGLEALGDFAERRGRLVDALDELTDVGDEVTAKVAEKLSIQLDALEPSVTMIGQVKAGKTSLVNAMIGLPELLPSDVNPWTSVVTALHLSSAGFDHSVRASFKFFGDEEWQRLFSRGGRIGELASRAGAEDEVEKVHRQLTELRDKSKRRLGRRFEMLLSQQHDYSHFDRQLIERYVVLGDDFENDTDTGRQTGKFADITRSADLFIERPDLPMGLCIRDTPGVNDTFMIREQITIRSIRESRLCVVVLSAHQALSNVDLALVRLISNVKSREVVIFVNRIDELADPGAQVPEIEASIRATLKAHQGPEDCRLIFGSAYWAGRALSGDLKGMEKASADSLVNWAQKTTRSAPKGVGPEVLIWELSGVPTLMRALSERIAEGEGKEAMDRAIAQARNLAAAMRASSAGASGAEAVVSVEEIESRLAAIEDKAIGELSSRFERIEADFDRRLERAHKSFLDRATAALITHLETQGEDKIWQYDPAGLRMLLRTAYQVFAAHTNREVQGSYDDAAEELGTAWLQSFEGLAEGFRIEPPQAPRVPPPVQIGQTIALDLKGSWWRRWWQRRRGYANYAGDFRDMIAAETRPMVEDLGRGLARMICEEASRILREFLEAQRELVLNAAVPDAEAVGGDSARVATGLARVEALLDELGD